MGFPEISDKELDLYLSGEANQELIDRVELCLKGHDDSIQQKISQKIPDTELFNYLRDETNPSSYRKIGIALKLNPVLNKRMALLEEDLLDQGYYRLDGVSGYILPSYMNPSLDKSLYMSNKEVEILLKGEASKEIITKFHINLKRGDSYFINELKQKITDETIFLFTEGGLDPKLTDFIGSLALSDPDLKTKISKFKRASNAMEKYVDVKFAMPKKFQNKIPQIKEVTTSKNLKLK